MPGRSIAIGRVAVTALPDRGPSASIWRLRDAFPNVPAERWEPFRRRFPQCFPAPDEWCSDLNVALVRTPRRVILVDAGDGPVAGPAATGERGQLPASLAAAGLAPDDVDTVVLTHLHPDHLGWTATAAGAPTFPRARYLLHADEWAFVHRPEVRADYAAHWFDVEAALAPLAAHGALDLLTGEAPIADEVTAVPLPGHTGGHMGLLIASEGERLLLMGDAMHHPAQVTAPGWSTVWDADPATASATRAWAAAWADREGLLVSAYHFPRPGWGRVVRTAGRRVWEPL